jgi:hypothetical protein
MLLWLAYRRFAPIRDTASVTPPLPFFPNLLRLPKIGHSSPLRKQLIITQDRLTVTCEESNFIHGKPSWGDEQDHLLRGNRPVPIESCVKRSVRTTRIKNDLRDRGIALTRIIDKLIRNRKMERNRNDHLFYMASPLGWWWSEKIITPFARPNAFTPLLRSRNRFWRRISPSRAQIFYLSEFSFASLSIVVIMPSERIPFFSCFSAPRLLPCSQNPGFSKFCRNIRLFMHDGANEWLHDGMNHWMV